MKEQTLPKWFTGVQYAEGAEVTNPFSGHSYYLNEIELSLYDFIIGSQRVFEEFPIPASNDKRINDLQKALTWFMVNNPEAYRLLLD